MASSFLISLSRERPILAITIIFVVWKAAIAIITATSLSPGYDTSTILLDWPEGSLVLPKFVRWDAIYFIQMAEHGHIYEQQWAFGIGISATLQYSARILFATKQPTLWQITLAGMIVCHVSSYISTLLIWAVSHRVMTAQDKSKAAISFLAAVLYIISPAGIFLSAPYTESPFAVLNMSAYLAFLEGRACFSRDRSIAGAFFTVSAGVFAALGTIMRSNGILSGGLFAWDAAFSVVMLLKGYNTMLDLIRLGSVGLAGLITGLGAVFPQYLAYIEYCTPGEGIEVRSWCKDTIPSIFTFVQSHYWNVGLFRYWTLSNLPLFALAAPTLYILVLSAAEHLRGGVGADHLNKNILSSEAGYLAAPQLVLALLAIASYHVQIITRISSGYPFWYIWLATQCQTRTVPMKVVVKWMVLYGVIQAGLYSSFLPPA